EDGIRDFHVTGVQTCALPILGVYQAKLQEGMSGMMLRTILSILIAAATLSLIYYVLEDWVWYLGRGVLALASVLAIFLLGISRSLFFFIADEEAFKHRVLVLGAGRRAREMLDQLSSPLDKKGFCFVGFVPASREELPASEMQ